MATQVAKKVAARGRRPAVSAGVPIVPAKITAPGVPDWALTIIAVDVVALYGLCAYGSRANLDLAA